ncbi:intermembrane lipid transfer protein VPS13B-like [Paramacrobiotus metropolitanus]|uniref:intermembrane lipid transfer protein VPS13B-like n=1 Tax=Paramacrobiotus metropolitanus TaxID=2943436 RepID=UPI0024462057|nr:intermembrane lipid transfer protein VPS13B-like [Paramacrobiotus metropolitanus]
MFKLESFVTPLLANYLNKYIKDLKADDLQLSLWKGEAVLNKLDLRLDAIEHDLGLPITFVSGNIQELRIKVPWTRLTAERVVIAVNTMECVIKLRTTARTEDSVEKDRARTEKKAPDGDANVAPPPPGYMESLTTRVLNNVHIHFTNLILRYVDEDFTLNILVKSANYFTVNNKWEKAFVEVAQPDLSLRRILVFQDLHISLNDGRNPESQPLVERAFVTCRFLTKFDSPDCRVALSSVMSALCDECHISLLDAQVPMIRRLVDLAVAFQAGLLEGQAKSEKEDPVDEENVFVNALTRLTDDSAPSVTRNGGSSSWTSWALSFIPSSPSSDHVEDVDLEAGIVPPKSPLPTLAKATTVALYGRKLSISFAMAIPGRNSGRSGRRSVMRLEIENAFLYSKSRQAKFSNFRLGIENCRIVALNECPCGRNNPSENVLGQPILTFSNFENPPSDRLNFLAGSLFGTNDDEKEITDHNAPFDTFDSYMAYNTEAVLLRSFGTIVVDSVSVIEPPADMVENLPTITPLELEYSNWKQNAMLRVLVSPPLLTLGSSALHRILYFYRWFCNYRPANYVEQTDSPNRSPLAALDEHRQLLTYIPMKSWIIVILRPAAVLLPPSHPPLPSGLRFPFSYSSRDITEALEKDTPAVLIQADRFEYHQTSPIYFNRILDVAVTAQGLLGDTLRHRCYIDCSAVFSSLELALVMFRTQDAPTFRDIRTLVLPANVHYSAKRPVVKTVCDRLWGPQNHTELTCKSMELGASLSELLLGHLCLLGLWKDCGMFLSNGILEIIIQNTFNISYASENVLRIDIKCGHVVLSIAETNSGVSQSGKIGSLEVSTIVGDGRGSVSPFLRDRAFGLAEFGSGTVNQDGRMRLSAYNITLEKGSSLSRTECIYMLRMPSPTKFTVYSNFVRPLVDNLNLGIDYIQQLNYADILRSATVNSNDESGESNLLPTRFEIQHEKISIDVLDAEWEYLSASVHSGRFVAQSHHPNTSWSKYDTRALLLYLGRSSRDPILGPVSGSVMFQSFGVKESTVSFLTADVSLVPLRVGPLTIPTAVKVWHGIQEHTKILLSKFHSSPVANGVRHKELQTLRFVVSQDDLRTQKWMYREMADGENDPIPDVQQICFCETPTKQTMAWRYGELRTISSVAIIPIPFQVSQLIRESSHEIICTLQYFKRPVNKFVGLRSFTLMESKECIFQFPDLVPEDFDRLPISDVWRVEVSIGIQGDQLIHMESGFLMSVKSLAGCMKINSAAILGVPKAVHASLNVGVASMALIHHVPVLPRTPGHSLISGYTYDSSYPSDQEFSRIKLDKVVLHGRCVGEESRAKFHLESNFWVAIDFANYRFLTLQPLLESCCFSSSVSYTMDDKMYMQVKIDSKTPLVIHCGQNVLHTFSMAKIGWHMAQTGNYQSLPVMNHLMICNDTCHVVRVRQYKTDECIYIKPKEMHPYSWRSQRIEQKLQFSVEPYPNLWSEPHNSEVSCQLCSFPGVDDFELGLVCNIRALNNIQKQIVLGTQLMLNNQLDHDVEVQLFVEPDYVINPVVDSPQEIMLLPARSYSSTRCVPVIKIKRCRVRFCGSAWSDLIQIASSTDPHVVAIPCMDGGCLDVWSTLVVPLAPSGSRWLVLSPLLRGCCHLPYPFKMEFEHESGARFEFALTPDVDCYLPVRYSTVDYQVRCRKENFPPQTFQLNLEKTLQQLPVRLRTVDSAMKIESNDDSPIGGGSNKSQLAADNECAIATSSFLVLLRRELPYANTLRFSIIPNGVCLRNEYDDDLVICGVDDEVLVSIPRKDAAVLPVYKGQLRLGVQSEETIYLSEYFGVKPSQTARQNALDCTSMAILLCEGYMNITFWEKRDGQYLIHHLTLSLKDENMVKVLTIRSRYVAVRTTSDADDVLLSAFIVPKVHTKLNYMDELRKIPSDKLTSRIFPLSPFVYVSPPNHPVDVDPNRVPHLAMFVCVAAETPNELKWSYPREIREGKNSRSSVVTIVAPGLSNTNGFCFKASVMEDHGICYIAFERLSLPSLILCNNCTYPLSFGECTKKAAGIVTFEEAELFLPLPSVGAGEMAWYALPSRDEMFPAVSTTGINYRFRIGRVVRTGASNNVAVWSSTSVDPFSSSNDSFISIPGICYLKLHFDRQNRHTVRITIDPLSRVGTPILLPGNASPALPLPDVPPSPSSHFSFDMSNAVPSSAVNIGVSCVLKGIVITLDDEISKTDAVAEVLRLSLDDLSVQFYCDGDKAKTYECAINISDLQLDNQLYDSGFFDFPVILAKEAPKRNVQSAVNLLCKLNPTTFHPENIHISLAPMACFVEDCLAFHLLRLVDTFLAPALLVSEAKAKPLVPRSPASVTMERIHIAPLEVYLSIHAALKIFVALDKTPLSFGEIECYDLNSTVDEIWRFVSAHYVKETLLSAGWVIGSMDILGNPANLLRSLTSGCNDLFVRPFSSLHAGPVSFLQGIAEGASAFLTSISAGTISSVTNLAESVSRNLDQISLDQEHIMRQMEVKYRQRPEGLASGLQQGLVGFGMGLLGAVAGLVDQPMQAMMRPKMTSAQFITALMLGVTKGVVGAVSKPIAGAAGLVSKTGQGILRGQGLLNFPPRRCVAAPKYAIGFVESTLKYIWKVAPLLPNTVHTLCVVEALPVMKTLDKEANEPMCLFLTDSALFVISSADDEFRQAYALAKLNIRVSTPSDALSHTNRDLMQVTLLIETREADEEMEEENVSVNDGKVTHFVKESYLLEWKDARLFEELFLVAKSSS